MNFKEISDELASMVDVLAAKKAAVDDAQHLVNAAKADYEQVMVKARELHAQHKTLMAEALPALNASERR